MQQIVPSLLQVRLQSKEEAAKRQATVMKFRVKEWPLMLQMQIYLPASSYGNDQHGDQTWRKLFGLKKNSLH